MWERTFEIFNYETYFEFLNFFEPLYFINIQLKKEFTLTKSTQKKVISKKPLGNNSLNTKRCVFRVLGLNPKL
jgi:hypothetical protein